MARRSECLVQLIGFVGNEPTLRHLPDGTPVINVRVLENLRWKDAAGEAKEKTIGHDCERFGPYAEAIAKLATKGSYVMIKAGVAYKDIEGQQYAKSVAFRIEDFYLLDKAAKREAAGPATDESTTA